MCIAAEIIKKEPRLMNERECEKLVEVAAALGRAAQAGDLVHLDREVIVCD